MTSRLPVSERKPGRLACLAILAAALLVVCVLPQAAGAKGLKPANAGSEPAESMGTQLSSTPNLGYSLTPSKVEPYAVCPPEQGQLECMAIAVPTAATRAQAGAPRPSFEGTGEEGGFSPSEIREAYGITEAGGSKQTVAIVDAYNDPNAETDLKAFREHYKLYYKGTEAACTESNGCFKKVDQSGETEKEAKERSKKFPANEAGWSVEISIDVEGVSCSSATACTAVGDYKNGSDVEVPLVERWNGTTWSIQTTPIPSGATASNPFSVSCAGPTACTFGGYYVNSEKVRVGFVESWNGTEWTVQSVPTPTGSTTTTIDGMSCTSSTACTAVGYYTNSSAVKVTLAERWNGTEWVVQSTRNPEGAKFSVLIGASCTTSTSCTAAGYYDDSEGMTVPLAEHWNGIEWQIQSTPTPEGGEGWLAGGVSCSAPASCAAVGYPKALAEIYG